MGLPHKHALRDCVGAGADLCGTGRERDQYLVPRGALSHLNMHETTILWSIAKVVNYLTPFWPFGKMLGGWDGSFDSTVKCDFKSVGTRSVSWV